MSAVFAACALFAAHLAAAIIFIPPWQNPDEPQHYMKAWLYATHSGSYTSAWRDVVAEREVVRSMAEHGWWAHYRYPLPDPVPTTFADGPARVVDGYFGPTPGGGDVYYRVVGALFSATSFDTLLRRLYVMRLLSAIAALVMFWVIVRATATCLDRRSVLVIPALVALHPQLAIASTTAGPDAWVNAAGAVVWWQGVRALRGALDGMAWSVLAAALGTLIRRVAAPLVLAAFTLPVLWLLSRQEAQAGALSRILRVANPGLAAVLIAGALIGAEITAALEWTQFDAGSAVGGLWQRGDTLPTFVVGLFQSFWFVAGWLQYRVPAVLYMAVALLCGAAFCGLILGRQRVLEGRVVVFAGIALACQIVAIVVFHFGAMQTGPQGRYLFPVIAPALTIVWLGWRSWFPTNRHDVAALTLTAAIAVFAGACWLWILLPVYS